MVLTTVNGIEVDISLYVECLRFVFSDLTKVSHCVVMNSCAAVAYSQENVSESSQILVALQFVSESLTVICNTRLYSGRSASFDTSQIGSIVLSTDSLWVSQEVDQLIGCSSVIQFTEISLQRR